MLGFVIYPESEGGNLLQNISTYLHSFTAQYRADIVSVADIGTAVGRNFVLADIAVSPFNSHPPINYLVVCRSQAALLCIPIFITT
jgi:hypothetical protein